jgi:hypothetical protein
MATRDATGKFVKEEDEAEFEAVAEAPAKMPPLRLQSKFKDLRIMIQPTRRIFHPTLGIEVIPGVSVAFEGPQRIFDSEYAQQKYGWDDALRDRIERKLVAHKGFMGDYYPAPLSVVPDHLLEIARVKPPTKKRYCDEFAWVEGELKQCPNEVNPGSPKCLTHDPNRSRILHGGGTTIG